ITPLMCSAEPSVVNSRSRKARRSSSLGSSPSRIGSRRLFIVPVLSSAARMPLPSATISRAVAWMSFFSLIDPPIVSSPLPCTEPPTPSSRLGCRGAELRGTYSRLLDDAPNAARGDDDRLGEHRIPLFPRPSEQVTAADPGGHEDRRALNQLIERQRSIDVHVGVGQLLGLLVALGREA